MADESFGTVAILKRGSACQETEAEMVRALLALASTNLTEYLPWYSLIVSSTGEKPSCGMCIKNSQECVYDDPPRSKNRIRKLEDKIARLEAMLSQANSSPVALSSCDSTQRRKSSGGFPYPTPSYAGPSGVSEVSHPARQVKCEKQKAFSQAFNELWGMSSVSGYGSAEAIKDRSQSLDRDTSNSPPMPTETDYVAMDVLNQLIGEAGQVGSVTDPWNIDPTAYQQIPISIHQANTVFPTPQESISSLSPSVPPTDCATTLRAYVIEREDLPEPIKYSLLKTFFTGKNIFGIHLNLDRFWSSLREESSENQPHPAFLFAIYHCVSQLSSDIAVRAMDDLFYEMAKKLLDQGIDSWDSRTIDLIRASTALSYACYAKAKFLPAWVLGGLGMRLCSLAHLQRITFPLSSTSVKYPKVSTRNPKRKYCKHRNKQVRPPKDAIELGDYIHVFWNAWAIDKSGATATGFAPAMHWSEIETPFPLPLEKYADIDSINSQPRTAVYDLFDDSKPIVAGDLSASCHYIALLFLNEASRLQDEFIQPSTRNTYLAHHLSSPAESFHCPVSTASSSNGSPDQDLSPGPTGPVPVEIIQLHSALSRFVRSLPADRVNPARKVLGGAPCWKSDPTLQQEGDNPSEAASQIWGVDPDTVLMHTEIHTAFALLYQERSDFEPSAWAQAVSSARSVVKILHIIAEVDFSRFSLNLVVCWRHTAFVLLEEVKRHRSCGNEEEALQIAIEVELIVLALKRIGELFALGNSSAEVIQE
ncbi:Zn(2)-C6 fungal-type DNA-binding domain [Phaffia rhodozyma]|uniref:Zn(2)-C6 fungal-type DNA-binding domain n=1 Tax=Phaffia rhodozyma TaxID=264483 RepID=A0A0F7ST50_PHARH|nr:Zn(2)-C6 fungal-type DNA-binding domain [Phaffia rhodozyma]